MGEKIENQKINFEKQKRVGKNGKQQNEKN